MASDSKRLGRDLSDEEVSGNVRASLILLLIWRAHQFEKEKRSRPDEEYERLAKEWVSFAR